MGRPASGPSVNNNNNNVSLSPPSSRRLDVVRRNHSTADPFFFFLPCPSLSRETVTPLPPPPQVGYGRTGGPTGIHTYALVTHCFPSFPFDARKRGAGTSKKREGSAACIGLRESSGDGVGPVVPVRDAVCTHTHTHIHDILTHSRGSRSRSK